MSERYEQGMKIRRAVLGDRHVDAAEARKTDFDAAFQALITENAWGGVWARDAISLRERSMLTIALLAAGGKFREALLHVAVYAGVPRANRAIAIARQTFAEMGIEL